MKEYCLQSDKRGYPLPSKVLRALAQVIASRRSSVSLTAGRNPDVPPPGKNWPRSIVKRHEDLVAKTQGALDWARHGHNIYDKVMEWFDLIEPVLCDPAIRAENVYNMDETGILLSSLRSRRVIVSKNDRSTRRGTGVKRELVTAIECISAAGQFLDPLIIWPAKTHRSIWTTHPTPGWHFATSPKGYTDSEISLYWIKNVFDPLTRPRAKGRPRVLINDGFATHESVELMTFCFENNILQCRLPSHTSHKLQPCDVAVFGPLKTAYREQVENLYRGGADTVGKQHFTLLYSRARDRAFTIRNIKSGFAATGLIPSDRNRVLQDIPRPPAQLHVSRNEVMEADLVTSSNLLPTPVTAEGLHSLCSQIERENQHLDPDGKHRVQKLANAAQKLAAKCALLGEKNNILFAQNNEKKTRSLQPSTVVGTARVMSYADIVEARRKRAQREATTLSCSKRGRKRQTATEPETNEKRPRLMEVEKGEQEIETLGLGDYCSVLQF